MSPLVLSRLRSSLKVALLASTLVASLLVTATGANLALESLERTPQAYGQRVDIGPGSLNVYEHGTTGPTIVLLGGYGTAAPAVDYAPLIRQLDGYRLVVVEGFGYGYSDNTDLPRTVENITAELHTVLAKLDVAEPYVLAGHSIAGLYMLYYANLYGDELAAVVELDASVPGQINGLAGGRSFLEQFAFRTGLLRVANALMPSLSEPAGDFTPEERRQILLMTNWNNANSALVNEAHQLARTFRLVATMKYPSDLPVLSIIKKTGSQPYWKELHIAHLAGLDHSKLVELDGGHYLHWTLSTAIADDIDRFLVEAGVER